MNDIVTVHVKMVMKEEEETVVYQKTPFQLDDTPVEQLDDLCRNLKE